jgi:hypothetical protein
VGPPIRLITPPQDSGPSICGSVRPATRFAGDAPQQTSRD